MFFMYLPVGRPVRDAADDEEPLEDRNMAGRWQRRVRSAPPQMSEFPPHLSVMPPKTKSLRVDACHVALW